LYKVLDELISLKLWKEKQERKEKGKTRVEEISQDERGKIREEERSKILRVCLVCIFIFCFHFLFSFSENYFHFQKIRILKTCLV